MKWKPKRRGMRKTLTWVGSCVFLLSVVFLLSSCGGVQDKKSEKPSKKRAVKREKKNTLVIYSALKEEADAIKNAYEARYDVDIDLQKFSSGEILYNLTSNEGDVKPCVWVGGPSDLYVTAKSLGLLLAYVPDGARDLPKEYKDKDGYWTGLYVGAIGFISNKEKLKQKRLPVPSSWKDLLNPKFQGEIIVPNPMTSGTGFIILSTLVQLFGEGKAIAYLKKLHENKPQYVKSGGDPGKKMAAGEGAAGIAFAHDILPAMEKSAKLVMSFPKEGTGYEIGAAGLLKGCENVKEAKKFLDWLTSIDAKDLFLTANRHRLTLMGTTHSFVFPYKDIQIFPNTSEWAGSNRGRIIRKWYDEVMRK